MDISEVFWNASLEELKLGYIDDGSVLTCLLCGQSYEHGRVYPEEGVLYEVKRYMRLHIEKAHGSVFNCLLQMDKKLNGLTDHQKRLLELFYEGRSDAEVQEATDIGSASTIRNHRFVLKEKERQARILLAIMELLKDKARYAPAMVEVHQGVKMVDERYNITVQESERILKRYFPEELGGRLKTFTMKEKARLVVLRELAGRFKAGLVYSEKEVNSILISAWEDYATVRRCLVDYGFLERQPDGSQYQLK